MRAFKIWNKNRTASFDLSGLNVITTDIAGLGNRFTNELYDGRIKKHLVKQYNSFEQISLTVNFGVNSNAYQKYREFMNFIQANGRNILVIEYYTTGTSRFVDVVLSNTSKSQKTGFGVLVETVTFDRLTPYYIMYRRTGTSIRVSNNYMEKVMPKITMSGRLYPAGTKITAKSKNHAMFDLEDKEYLGDGVYRILGTDKPYYYDYNVYNGNHIIKTAPTGSGVGYSFYVPTGTYTITIESNNNNKTFYLSQEGNVFYANHLDGGVKRAYTFYNVHTISIFLYDDGDFTTEFKLQIEKAGNALELDRPFKELNNYTLRERFQNRNMVMPDLSGKDYLGDGVYRLYRLFGITIEYNVYNGEYAINGTASNVIRYELLPLDTAENTYASAIYVSGSFTSPGLDNILLSTRPSSTRRSLSFKNSNSSAFIGAFTGLILQLKKGQVFTNYKFKLQLEKGSQATPYQVPTRGPYNNLDISTLGLTPEQVTYYGNLYNTLLETPTEYSIPVTDTREIELNKSVHPSQKLIIDSENKSVTLNGANAYQITNKDKSTFLSLPEGDYSIECDLPFELEYKKWVID